MLALLKRIKVSVIGTFIVSEYDTFYSVRICELRITNWELGKAHVLYICSIPNVKFNIENYQKV